MGIELEVVGREVELDRLYRLIDGAVEHGGALLVIGDPGFTVGYALTRLPGISKVL